MNSMNSNIFIGLLRVVRLLAIVTWGGKCLNLNTQDGSFPSLMTTASRERLKLTSLGAGQTARGILESVGIVKRLHQVAAFILAGGVSSRMGREKGLLEFGGETLIVRTARLLESLDTEVTVVGPAERYEILGLRAIADQNIGGREGNHAVRTPLVGIATALYATESPWNLILACDLPYLTAEWPQQRFIEFKLRKPLGVRADRKS